MPRDVAKAEFIKMLFQHNQVKNPIKDVFRTRFPAFADMLMVGKYGNHRNLAWMLQQYEAHTILELVAARFAEQKIPLLTIHDSVIVRSMDESTARTILHDELLAFVGTAPRIRVSAL